MLIIDDNMFRLAKMQETLLKVSNSNRDENLKKYQQIVSEIDTKAFADILDEIKHIDEHNHSLESELNFLEGIVKTYDQLLELQSGFKRVCEKYGDLDFELSDLSRLNIEYIKNRISAIKGYLTNLRNIETNEDEIEKLNAQLREQLKQKALLDSRLLEFENSLRENFVNTEGRIVEDDRLVPTSVVIEYKKIGFDFVTLLSNSQLLNEAMSKALESKNDALLTLEATEVCYNNDLTEESKQFLDKAKVDYLKEEYVLTMLKIVKLLSENRTEYADVVKKREDLLELIEYRFSCLTCLRKVKSKDKNLDPFIRTKVQEQLDVIGKLADKDINIDKITKKIGDLVALTEEMIKQKTDNQIALTDTKSLIESNMSMGDVDITGVYLPVEEVVSKEVLPNQVVDIRTVSSKLNKGIVSQKTAGVISRVNGMVNRRVEKRDSSVSSIAPELIIVPKVSEQTNDLFDKPITDSSEFTVSDSVLDEVDNEDIDLEVDDEIVEETLSTELPQPNTDNIDVGLFETVTPFVEPTMFSERSDETELSKSSTIIDFPTLENNDNVGNDLSLLDDTVNDNFWVTQSSYSDEQIGKILSLSYEDNSNKVRKKAA